MINLQTVIREQVTFDCNKATPVVLSTNGVLENFNHRNHNSALVACKRLSGNANCQNLVLNLTVLLAGKFYVFDTGVTSKLSKLLP